jgi:hypothetical protein
MVFRRSKQRAGGGTSHRNVRSDLFGTAQNVPTSCTRGCIHRQQVALRFTPSWPTGIPSTNVVLTKPDLTISIDTDFSSMAILFNSNRR